MKILRITSFVLTVVMLFAMMSVSAFAAEKLPAPANVSWEGTVAKWDLVEGATGYKIEVYKNSIFEGAVTYYYVKDSEDLSSFIAQGGEGVYMFRVIALGYGTDYEDSESSQLSVAYGEDVKELLIGDANLDGYVTVLDVTAIQSHLAQIIEFTDEQVAVSDTYADGYVTITDATQIQLYIAKIIDKLG